jgi:hypothetical protein
VHVAVNPAQDRAELVLRLGVLGCFVGHGVQALSMRADWQPFLFGLPVGLMVVVGAVDVAMGVLAFATRSRAVLAWCATWGLVTALLRPLAGFGFVEVLLRAGNVGPALALLSGSKARAVLIGSIAIGLTGLILARGPSEWHGVAVIEVLERAGALSMVVALVVLRGRPAFQLIRDRRRRPSSS